MKVFLSWSGAQSRAVAEALYEWLPKVIQAVKPFLSTELDKGARWGTEIDNALEGTRFGLIVLTRENLESPWLLYEAGALSKAADAFVWTFLVGLSPTDVKLPLANFQHTVAEKREVQRLIQTIRRQVEAVGDHVLGAQLQDDLFELLWPQLEDRLSKAQLLKHTKESSPRSDRDLLEEVLEILRQQERQRTGTLAYRAVAYLANLVEQALKAKDGQLGRTDIGWELTSDQNAIYLSAERRSDGTRFRVSVPVKSDWPKGSSWSYAAEMAEELRRLLRERIREEPLASTAANTEPQPDGTAGAAPRG
jgi:TIR domain